MFFANQSCLHNRSLNFTIPTVNSLYELTWEDFYKVELNTGQKTLPETLSFCKLSRTEEIGL